MQHRLLIGKSEQDIYGQVLGFSFDNFVRCPSGTMRAEKDCEFPYSAALEIMETGETAHNKPSDGAIAKS